MKTKIGIPIGLALVMFLGVFTAMLAFGTLSPQPAEALAAPSATRSFDMSTVAPGGTLTVTIEIADFYNLAEVTETLPNGFTYTGTSLPTIGANDPAEVDGQMVTFSTSGLLGEAHSRSFTYTVSVDQSVADGPHGFSGTLSTTNQVGGEVVDFNAAVGGATMVTVVTTPEVIPMMVSGFMVDNTVKRPGVVSGYSFSFTTAKDLVANQDTITVHFDKDFKGHGTSLSRNHVTVSAYMQGGDATIADTATIERTGAYNPGTDATLDRLGTAHPVSHANAHSGATRKPLTNSNVLNNIEYLISVPDMNGTEDGAPGIAEGSVVTLTISPAAGITNATAGGNPGPLGVYTSEQPYLVYGTVRVTLGIALNDYDANRGKALTVLGRGFQDGTTATIYLDNANGMRQELVGVPVASDDTFQAQFTVTVPPFVPGDKNTIYAEDGNEPPNVSNRLAFEVEGLLTVSPSSAAVGDELDITLEDWPDGSLATMVTAVDGGEDCMKPNGNREAGYSVNNGVVSCYANTVTIAGERQRIIGSPTVNGYSASFRIEIGTGTPSGTDEIKVTANGENDTKKITISGADLSASPTTAVPNQAITVNGQGFTGDGTINALNDGSEVSLGGDDEALSRSAGGFKNFNNGESVTVDSGGSWSATIIIPITSATTTPGTHSLDVMDNGKRSGSVDITIPKRTLTIEPAEARPGESVTLTGTGFPASNTRTKEHNTPSIEITYADDLVGTAIPDGDGNITLSFRVPLDAAIPSTNRVEANYRIPDAPSGSAPVEAFVNHEIPGARVSLSMDEGKPGDRVTLTGDGFKAFASIEYIRIGGIEVTPAPRPATDRNGEFTATILVPDLAAGTNSIEVKVGVTAHANFKVLDTAVSTTMTMMEAEDATPAEAFADLIAEDNLVRVYHFNKHEQTDPDTGGWSLYDTREAFMSLNSIEMIEAGEFYWLMVNNEQLNVELGSERVDLVAGWNQIRW